MLEKFRTYQASVRFYHAVEGLTVPTHLRDQLLRAASSISLNLAEGAGRMVWKDRQRFYKIAFGSFRECQAVLDLAGIGFPEVKTLQSELGAQLYKLCTWRPSKGDPAKSAPSPDPVS